MNSNLQALQKFKLEEDNLLVEVIEGLQQEQKQLPCKLFYDAKGSSLFDQICKLKEYYLTRTEMEIMNKYTEEISFFLRNKCLLIELGSGSSKKVRLLLDHLGEPAGYVPVDISEQHLMMSVSALAKDYPKLKIVPVYADYTKAFELPLLNLPWSHKVIFYPGSSIGNFTLKEATVFLERIAKLAGKTGGLLIGVDLKKDRDALEAAYNDKNGITAQFNLNILRRINRELEADFDLDQWRHYAFYNTGEGRIEMHLISCKNQYAHIDNTEFFFRKGESILTEYSYKYTIEEFRQLVSGVFKVEHVWTDDECKFSVQYLSVKQKPGYRT
jgi:dimethylhistidine N-methyltransferase